MIERSITSQSRGQIAWQLFLGLAVTASLLAPTAASAKDAAKKEGSLDLAPDDLLPAKDPTWLTDFDDAMNRARNDRKPLLIRVTATWCPACRMLDRTMAEQEVNDALTRWICVEIDAERNETLADELGVTGVPALRLRTPSGRPAGSHDGAIPAKALIAWLDEHYDEARAAVDDVLMETGQPLSLDVLKLIALFDRRDPAVREAAMRRLLPYPETARAAVVEAVRDGNLATRLTALELLGVWNAPLAGLDPWDPETMTETRLETLDRWTTDTSGPSVVDVFKASEKDLAAAAAEIDRMLLGTNTEAEAIGERLARFGQQLLPAVTQRMQSAAGDREQVLLRVLRYRLVASNSLALNWPGGLWRLASPESDQRRKAAEELATRATQEDQTLLLELFSDSDPLVREISLRGLQNIGGAESIAALTRLLSDPEPNVRAAVLKQLEENPHKNMLPAVIAYLEKETDADLVVHGIRFLRSVANEKAVRGMMSLLQHADWQVRAEAAEGLSKSDTMPTVYSGQTYGAMEATQQSLKVDVSVALLKLLEDPEPFVVAKALEGLGDVDMEVAVDPLVAAVQKHPSLAEQIVGILAAGEQMRPKALPHLVAFCNHEEPAIRAAAITGLARSGVAAADKQLLVGLKDSETRVRTAAANALFVMFDRIRQQKVNEMNERRIRSSVSRVTVTPYSFNTTVEPSPGLLNSMFEKLKGALGAKNGPVEAIEAAPAEEEEAVEIPALPELPEDASSEEMAEEAPVLDGIEPETPEKESEDKLAGIVWETWLEQFFAGKNRPSWADEALEPLSALLESDDVEERIAAARALVPLGHFETALPVVLAAVDAQPTLFEPACAVLPWLPWEQRHQTYARLRPRASDSSSLNTLIDAACGAPDRRIAGLLWKELADDSLDEYTVSILQDGLTSAYSGRPYYWSEEPLPAAALRDFQKTAVEMLDSGSLLQRLVTMALCCTFKTYEATPKANAFLKDAQAGDELQIAAARYLLLSLPESEAVRTAVGMLDDPREEIREAAVALLAGAGHELGDLGRGSRASSGRSIISYSSSEGKPIVPLPPKALKAGDVLPLYESETNEKIRAYLAYLLALFGENRGLDELIRYWHDHKDDDSLRNFVYQAIASLDDSSKSPILAEIYEGFGSQEGTASYEIRTFYWTIRIMTGPEVLRLRKRIRDELGMSELR